MSRSERWSTHENEEKGKENERKRKKEKVRKVKMVTKQSIMQKRVAQRCD